MDITSITFGLKDVIAISLGLISVVSFVYALKGSNEKSRSLIESLKDRVTVCETELKDLDSTLTLKIDNLAAQLSVISNSLAELTGYIKAKVGESHS